MAPINKPTSPAGGDNLSQAFDDIQAAGLQNINVDVDAAATIGTNSTAKSAATSNNVTGSSTSVADVAFNSGLQANSEFGDIGDTDYLAAGTNIVNVASDAGLSGIATTTAKSSAATSDGTATAFTNLGEAAGIQDLDSLQVGGELTALGKSLNTLDASAENVKGAASAYSQLSSEPDTGSDLAEIQGFEGTQINVKSDATLQGLAQLSNSAAASTSAGDATAESLAAKLQGADLQGLNVGGIASVTGQATLSNLSTAETVVETSLGANALSSLGTAQGLVANETKADLDGVNIGGSADLAAAGVTVSSDASLTGLASITNNATASATKGDAGARSIATDVEGASLNTVQIGGVGTIGGQATYSAKATAGNVDGGNSGALADLTSAQGLEANAALDVKSDATIQGLANISNDALASGTAAGSSMAIAEASTLIGATLADNTDIGGIGSITGQVTFGSKGTAENVSGIAKAVASLGDQGVSSNAETFTGGVAKGLVTDDATADNFGTDIKSDATIKGISSLNLQAEANTTNGLADADSYAGDIDGAKLGDVKIGGIGDLAGQASLTGNASSSNVLGGVSNADSQLLSADGLEASDLLKVASDGSIKGLSTINLSATAESTGGSTAHAGFNADTIQGANLDEVQIGGVGNVLGQASFTGAAAANNVTGIADAIGSLTTEIGLTSGAGAATNIKSDGTLKGIASVIGSATAETTAGNAHASDLASTIKGADFNATLDIGGIGSIQGAANFNLSAKSTNVTGSPNDASALSDAIAGITQATGLEGFNAIDPAYGIDIKSDASIAGTAIGSLKAEAFSTATDATATLGQGSALTGANIGDLNVGGIANLTGAAQLTGTATAENVGGAGLDATAYSGRSATVTGLTADYMNVASDSTTTAQAFGTLNADANSTGGNAIAEAGNSTSKLTGFTTSDEGPIDLNIGGIGNFSALAQGSETASASTVNGLATATAGMALMGAEHLDFNSSSDGTLTGIAKLVASVDASNIGNSTPGGNDASAGGNFSATGFSDLVIGAYGGAVGIGGVSTLKGQAQIAGTLNAESVSGDAFAGRTGTNGATPDQPSLIKGFDGLTLHGASDGTILGTASGVFNTNASSTLGNASGFSSQELRGINALSLDLGGQGTINAIVNDTNFVSAHSVSGNATAVASVDAIGLEGGSIHIAGNATIMANVGVDSKAESHTTGG